METPSLLSIFQKYLRDSRNSFLQFILFGGIFSLIYYLYNMPNSAICYALLLCTFGSCIAFLVQFYSYYNKIKRLTYLSKQEDYNWDLPEVSSYTETLYQQLLLDLKAKHLKLLSEMDSKEQELLDYYSLWVHQIKTPISAMRLLLETEHFPSKPDVTMELFKIEQYVEMVLQSLRLFSQSSDYVIKKCSLENIVRQTIRKYAKMFIGKKLSMDFREFSCEVYTDEKWLSFVMEQILSNALKYTKTGTISIYLENPDAPTLVIEDTGIGIYPEDLPRVCEKGFTGYNGRMDKKSTGIGLYLCKEILTKLNHTLSIESEIGKGTKVKIGLVRPAIEIRYE